MDITSKVIAAQRKGSDFLWLVASADCRRASESIDSAADRGAYEFVTEIDYVTDKKKHVSGVGTATFVVGKDGNTYSIFSDNSVGLESK